MHSVCPLAAALWKAVRPYTSPTSTFLWGTGLLRAPEEREAAALLLLLVNNSMTPGWRF